MALKSSLFAGDARVEAIAVSDASNVKYGDRGPHVAKIQQALNLIEKSGLEEDGAYGARTQQAVLEYKRARKIINYSYQTQADSIVGKMTIAALDDELWKLEEQSRGPMTLRVLRPVRSPADDYRETTPNRHSPMLSFAISQAMLNAGGLPAPAVAVQTTTGLTVATSATIDIVPGQVAIVEVKGGDGATVSALANFARVRDPVTGQDVTKISTNSQNIEIVGKSTGSMFVMFFRARWPQPEIVYLPLVVRNHTKTVYTPTMQPHDHRPSKQWSQVCGKIVQKKDTLAGIVLAGLCLQRSPPENFAHWAKTWLSTVGGPASVAHFDWYLHGNGVDYVENSTITQWINADSKLRREVADFVNRHKLDKQPYSSSIWFGQDMYGSTEHAYAFGTIDALYIEFDLNARYVKIWFKDIYEWHPVCEPYYGKPKSGDRVRPDNSLHAAMVEMKDKGARDYWMIGESTQPMSVFGI